MINTLKLRVPEPMKNDQYWSALIESVEEVLQEVKSQINSKSTQVASKESLLLESKSLGIGNLIKKLPLERGSALLREFRSMIKSKGSEWAVERMAQIYLGYDNLRIEYDYSNRSYKFVNVGYNESQELDEEMLATLHNAMRFVAPAGKKVGNVSVSAGDDFLYQLNIELSEAYEARGNRLLATHRVSGITCRIGELYGFSINPDVPRMSIQYRDESSLVSRNDDILVTALVAKSNASMVGSLASSEVVRMSELTRIGSGDGYSSSSTIASVNII